jgi:hypothetical protein
MKQNCIDALSTALTKASHWRATLVEQYPDHRNAKASKLLAKLAGEASNLSEPPAMA